MRRPVFARGFLVVLLLPASIAAAQECEGVPSRTTAPVIVYEAPPTFSTGQGWRLAPPVGELPPGAAVRICERRDVGFFGSQKPWARVRFDAGGGEREGWISAEGTLEGVGLRGRGLPRVVGEANAAGTGLPGATPDSGPLLAMVFAAMLFGMAAKGTIDHLGRGRHECSCVRDTLRAFIVSPIVFLGFSKLGDFGFTTNSGLAVFLCMAFQNGFFWQTVLGKAGPLGSETRSTAAMAGAPAR